MFRSLATAATGMEAQQTKLDVTANNIANVSTNGFKKGSAEFADLMYQNERAAGTATGNGTMAPSGTEIGLGTRLVSTVRDQSQGQLNQTGGTLDVAIQGKGYFQVTMPDGSMAYTRNGALQMDANGKLVTSDGYAVYFDSAATYLKAQNIPVFGAGWIGVQARHADRIGEYPILMPMTTEQSLVGGYDNTFGTWTNHLVTAYTTGKYTRPTVTLAYANSWSALPRIPSS